MYPLLRTALTTQTLLPIVAHRAASLRARPLRKERKWDETHLHEQVTLPRQVLIIGDGQAEKRSYDEHGNQARIYASRPGHSAVAQVGLKGVFLKDGPSFDEVRREGFEPPAF